MPTYQERYIEKLKNIVLMDSDMDEDALDLYIHTLIAIEDEEDEIKSKFGAVPPSTSSIPESGKRGTQPKIVVGPNPPPKQTPYPFRYKGKDIQVTEDESDAIRKMTLEEADAFMEQRLSVLSEADLNPLESPYSCTYQGQVIEVTEEEYFLLLEMNNKDYYEYLNQRLSGSSETDLNPKPTSEAYSGSSKQVTDALSTIIERVNDLHTRMDRAEAEKERWNKIGRR